MPGMDPYFGCCSPEKFDHDADVVMNLDGTRERSRRESNALILVSPYLESYTRITSSGSKVISSCLVPKRLLYHICRENEFPRESSMGEENMRRNLFPASLIWRMLDDPYFRRLDIRFRLAAIDSYTHWVYIFSGVDTTT